MNTQGLIGCELRCLRQEYEAGRNLDVPRGLSVGFKLPRLLLLGSQFLKAVSPQREHPAFKHGELIEMILEAGLGASTPHTASPGVPFQSWAQPLGPSAGTWLGAMSGISGMSSTRLGSPHPTSPAADPSSTASGEAMRILLDDITAGHGHQTPIDPGGLFENLDGMLIDWASIGRDWEGGDGPKESR